MWKNTGLNWQKPKDEELVNATEILGGTSWVLRNPQEIRQRALQTLQSTKSKDFIQNEILGLPNHDEEVDKIEDLIGTPELVNFWKNERERLNRELKERIASKKKKSQAPKVRKSEGKSSPFMNKSGENSGSQFDDFLKNATDDFMKSLEGFENVRIKQFEDEEPHKTRPMHQLDLINCEIGGSKDQVIKDSIKNLLNKVSKSTAINLVHCLSPIELRSKLHKELEEAHGPITEDEILEENNFEEKLRMIEEKIKKMEMERESYDD